MFFEDTRKKYHRIDNIRRIEPAREHSKGHSDIHRVLLIAGEDVDIYSRVFQRIMRETGSFFSAHQGTYIVRYSEGEDPEIRLTAVIGWSIDVDGFAVPITAEGMNDSDDEKICHTIMHPDGSIIVPSDGSFLSLEDFIAAEKAKPLTN